MRKTTVDEQGHTEEQSQDLAFAGKSDNGCHDEATSDSQQSGTQGADGKTCLKDALSRSTQVHGRQACQQGNKQAAGDVAQKDEEQLAYGAHPATASLAVAQGHETCSAGIER